MELQIDTDERVEVVDVTRDVVAAVPDGFETGVCVITVPHTTAGVIINEHEPRLISDVEELLGRLVPRDDDYAHNAIDDNADAHLRAVLLGANATVPIAGGELALGTWQSVQFVECDGPRTRRLQLALLSGRDL